MSYILFSLTSSSNGTRDKWLGPEGASTTTSAARVNGTIEAVLQSDFSADAALGDGDSLVDGKSGLYSLSSPTGLSNFTSAIGGTGNVIGASAAYQSGKLDRTLDSASSFEGGKLHLAVSDLNWNDLKNVEIFLDSATTDAEVSEVHLKNFVDARVKVGSEGFAGCFDIGEAGQAGPMTITIENAKRGQVDGSQSDMALNVSISLWSNDATWQNSFTNLGSVFGDAFFISYGELQLSEGSEFTAGQRFDADGSIADGDATSVSNGGNTTLFTQLGAGDDVYFASIGQTVAADKLSSVDAELMTIDYVWGGSGSDFIVTGGNNDVVFGDWGKMTVGGVEVGADADPMTAEFLLGGGDDANDPVSWVLGTGASIYYKTAGDAGFTTFTEADIGDVEKIAALDPLRYASGGVLVDEPSSTTLPGNASANPAARGLGVDMPSKGYSNGAGEQNPEINASTDTASGDGDVLGVKLGHVASSAKVGLSMFFSKENGSAPAASNPIETMTLTLMKDGIAVGSLTIAATESNAGLGAGVVSATGLASGHVEVPGSATATGAWGTANAAEVEVLIAAGASGFDAIEVTAGPYVTFIGGAFVPASATGMAQVSDAYLRKICYTPAAAEGNDLIDAGSGNDTITGGGGDDLMTGGAGKDVFVFDNDDGFDGILDFSASDKIRLVDGTIDDVTGIGTDTIVFGDTVIVALNDHVFKATDFIWS
jgi:hypothetical protein